MSAASNAAQDPTLDVRDGSRVLRWLEPLLFVLGLAAALGTLAMLLGIGVAPSERMITAALVADIVLAGLLVILLGLKLFRLYRARSLRQAGARLHIRVVALLGLVAALPSLIVGGSAMLVLERGLNPWFSGDLKVLVQNAGGIAQQFQQQLCQNIVREMRLMATDVERIASSGIYQSDRKLFRDFMTSRALFLGLPYAAITKVDGTVIERADVMLQSLQIVPTQEDFQLAATDEPPCIFSHQSLGALTKVRSFDDAFLVVGRPVDKRAIEFPLIAQAGVEQYQVLDARRESTQLGIALVFVLITLIVLLSAILLGFGFADRIVQPIRRLILATDEVAQGNLYVQVPVGAGDSDIAHLGSTFNNMTGVLRSQHNSLVAANDINDQRRRFMEAVLSGVPAGVIGVDSDGRISVSNPTAEKLIGDGAALNGRRLGDILPALAPMLSETTSGARIAQDTIVVTRGGQERTISVRVTSENGSGARGTVVTLDDITDLVSAQRTSAWADVARRIAHEIKNPLTPIQLSAERIRRKFGKVITEDRTIFDQCTDTIVRQVEDIKRMVDEFSSFARMPKPSLALEDVNSAIKEVAFMMRVAHPDIEIAERLPDGPLAVRFDRRLIAQAVQNIIKNATEAIAAVPSAERGHGRIEVGLSRIAGGRVAVDVIDNGKGFPTENRNRLLEPYMTTRDGGTGLGLAIVAKILEEHGGGIELNDAPGGRGAWVRMILPAQGTDTTDKATQESESQTA